jgi:hypothetical protein
MAVGKDRFREDARKVMAVLQQLQATQLEADDPTLSYMMQVLNLIRLSYIMLVRTLKQLSMSSANINPKT